MIGIDLGDDGEPYSYHFEQSGMETTWFLDNSSFIIWTWAINAALFVSYFLVRECARRLRICRSLRVKMHDYLFFNGPLRLFMETFLDLYLTSLLNVTTADTETENSSVEASNKTALAFFIAFSALVPLLGLVYFCKFEKINEKSNYGALLDGTRVGEKEKSKWILLFPAFFFVRRIAFSLSVLLFSTFLWAQLALQTAFSTALVIYLMHV